MSPFVAGIKGQAGGTAHLVPRVLDLKAQLGSPWSDTSLLVSAAPQAVGSYLDRSGLKMGLVVGRLCEKAQGDEFLIPTGDRESFPLPDFLASSGPPTIPPVTSWPSALPQW